MRVAVIGLGTMGMGAALSLLRARAAGAAFEAVYGCDPREGARAEFAAAGGTALAAAGEMPDGVDAVLTLVVNAAQTEAVLFGTGEAPGCAARLAPGAVVISSATMAPDAVRNIAARLGESGILTLDAPVSGGAARAREGAMTVMAAGSAAAFARAQPVLEAVAAPPAGKLWRLGDAVGIGATVKVVHQLLAGVHIAAAAEAMALGIRAGADPRALYDVVVGAAGNSWMFENRMARVLAGDDAPRSAVDIFVKDLGLVADMARGLDFPTPLAAQAQQLFTAARAMGQGGKDDGFVIRVWQALTGIGLPGDPADHPTGNPTGEPPGSFPGASPPG